jgi:7TM diverse intracellular signalling
LLSRLLLICLGFLSGLLATARATPRELHTGWSYQWPSREVGAESLPSGGDWIELADRPFNPAGRGQSALLFAKLELPIDEIVNPVVFLRTIDQAFRLYLDGVLIYEYGNFQADGTYQFSGYRFHVVQLPADFKGKELIWEIHSRHVNIGLPDAPKLGSSGEIYAEMVRTDVATVMLGGILIGLGLFCGIMGLRQRGNLEFIYFGLSAFGMGGYLLLRTPTMEMFWTNMILKFRAEAICLMVATLAILAFSAKIFGTDRNRVPSIVLRALALSYAILGVVILFHRDPFSFLVYWQISAVIALPYAIAQSVPALRRKDRDALFLRLE